MTQIQGKVHLDARRPLKEWEEEHAASLARQLLAERDRYREALEAIGTECENYTGGTTCVSANRTRGARYTADAWCKPCIAREAFGA